MISSKAVMATVILISGSVVQAESLDALRSELVFKGQKWQTVAPAMSQHEYKRAYRKNQRQVLKHVESYSHDALTAVGIPEMGVTLMNSAAAFAVTDNVRFSLNKSKTLGLGIKDASEGDRTLYFGVKFDW